MTCPRCGVPNGPDRTACVRCGGSLAPPPVRDDRPLPPVLPVTRRAELTMGRARGVPSAPSAAGAQGAGKGGDGLYLMASERSTGQPPPPEGVSSQRGPARAEAPGRIAIGLSGA